MDRRAFLRLAGSAAGLAAVGVGGGCGSGSKEREATPATTGSGPGGGERTLRVNQWSHFVPAYDAWFDNEFARPWGEKHDVDVIVDHVPFNEVTARADTEVARGVGHDIFGFVWTAAAQFEDHTIDHREIVEEAQGKLGSLHPLVERTIFNPRTKKYLGFSESWVPNVTHYRVDLWDSLGPGERPRTWDDVLRAGPRLKALGHPPGFSLGEGDPDATVSLMGVMHAYGSSVQNEDGKPTIDTPATVEAVKLMAAIYKGGMNQEVLTWDGTSNNRFLAGGAGSIILNPVSAIRAIEKQNPELASKIQLLPLPTGPAGNRSPYFVSTSVIWKFARNPELAKQFLVDLAVQSRDVLTQSEFYNLPSFPAAIPDLRDLVAAGTGRYALLADAATWTTNLGHPGPANAAVEEVFEQAIVTKMFTAAARGDLSADEAVKRAHAQAVPIFDKWRDRGKI
jgi:multiple sugar transport system substrate-binding protein